jgi:hypothetical protein
MFRNHPLVHRSRGALAAAALIAALLAAMMPINPVQAATLFIGA